MTDSIVTGRLAYPSASGGVVAYYAHPETGQPWPALILGTHFVGIDGHMEDVARRLAREGYFALLPDIYCHDPEWNTVLKMEDLEETTDVRRTRNIEEGLKLIPEERRAKVRHAVEWLENRDKSTWLPDLVDAVPYLQSRPDVRADAVGAFGFCMGGGLVNQLAATGADLAAAVVYYGASPKAETVPNIRCPVIGHYGADDDHITAKVPAYVEAMQKAGKNFTHYIYEGAPHAFNNDTRPESSYRPEASRIAWERTLAFLERHLKRVGVTP